MNRLVLAKELRQSLPVGIEYVGKGRANPDDLLRAVAVASAQPSSQAS